MTNKKLDDGLFGKIIDNAIDITDRFDIDLGGLPDDIRTASAATQPFLEVLRALMEKLTLEPGSDYLAPRQALISMEAWFTHYGKTVEEDYKHGEVIAVDGTPLISHKRFLPGQVYACAVGGLTSTDPMSLEAKLVKVMADLGNNATPEIDDLERIIVESDELTRTSSWPNAFRTYQEREFAFNSRNKYVLIDGPIVTEDLLTRQRGRDLYRKMLANTKKIYVGVIKDTHQSQAILRYHARALNSGELFVWNNLAGILERDGADGSEYSGDVKDFASTLGAEIVRGVYKPGIKPFGFECLRRDLPAAISLLWFDKCEQPGHEIPFLLDQVDAQLRGRYRPSETSRAIEASLAGQSDEQLFDEIDERDFR